MSLVAKKTKQQVVTELRCEEILDAARRLFSRRGFRDVGIDEIAAEAGLAKATVYQYFPSKQDIYLEALRIGVGELVDRTEREMKAAVGTRAKIEAFVRTRLEYLDQHRDFFAVYNSEFGNLTHPATLNSEFRKMYRRQFESLEKVVEQGMAQGELAPASANVLTVLIYESTRGLMLHHSLGWSHSSVEEQIANLMRVVWDGVGKKGSKR
jgi:AcrR family transcriptional regulator